MLSKTSLVVALMRVLPFISMHARFSWVLRVATQTINIPNDEILDWFMKHSYSLLDNRNSAERLETMDNFVCSATAHM